MFNIKISGIALLILLLPAAPARGQAAERLIVELGHPAGNTMSGTRTAQIRRTADAVASRLGLPRSRVRSLTVLPYLFIEAPAAFDRARLLQVEGVRAVYPDRINVAFLDQSLHIIGQPDAARNGATGRGRSVAVLDTGADYHVTDLGACQAPGPGCRVAAAIDTAPDDGTLDDQTRHGTNVAAIVARVAPEAGIIAIDVFDGAGAADSAILAGLDWVLVNRARHNIVAVNLSLGDPRNHVERCTGTPYDTAFQVLDGAGVAIVAAAGNEAVKNGLSSPACHRLAISVGATTDAPMPATTSSACSDPALPADAVACFSNSARTLVMLAPGHRIGAGDVTMSGTSQAAPHVSGAIAALLSTDPAMTTQAAVQRLRLTGIPVRDRANQVSTPRLSLGAAANRAPAAVADAGRIVEGGGGMFDVLGNDVDEDSASLELTGALAPAGCTAHVLRRRLYAVCDAGQTGERRFRYSIRDRYGDTGAGELALAVLPSSGIAPRVVSDGARVSRAFVADGVPMLAWIETGARPKVFVEWLRPDGSTMNNRFEISRGRPDIVYDQLSVDSHGPRVAIAWAESSGTNSATIIAAHLDGPVLGNAYPASLAFNRPAGAPSATVLSRQAVIGWQELWNPTRLHAAAFDNNTMPTPIGGVQILTRYQAPSEVRTVTVSDTHYVLIRRDESGVALSARRFDQTGADVWGTGRLLRETPERISDFDVTPLSDGTIAVAWAETENLSLSGIWYLRIDANGQAVQPATRVADGIAIRGEVAVAAAASGAFRIAWNMREPGFSAILSVGVDATGRAGPTEIDYYTAATATAGPIEIDLAMLANGRRQILWSNLSGQLQAVVRSTLP